jgi:hypothetical protein
MTIKLIMSRHVNPGHKHELYEFLVELRGRALRRPGLYLLGDPVPGI